MATTTASATTIGDDGRAEPTNDNDSSTVNTDDDEFSDFITSQWKDSVEVGLVIQYPLPFTNYIADNSSSSETNEKEAEQSTATATSTEPVVGKSIVVESGESHQESEPEDRPQTLPPLTLSTVLQEESIAPLFDGTQWAGTRVWKAAVIGLEYLLRERGHRRLGSLLELGCGLGVPGMVWKQMLLSSADSAKAARVVLTDRDSLVSQLQANVQANFPDDPSIEAMALDWSKEGIAQLLQNEATRLGELSDASAPVFDICLNCDCVYEPLYGREAWESLADVLSEVARTSPATLLVTALERRNGDNVEGFLAKLEASGHVETPIRRVVRHDEDPHHIIEIYVTQGKAAAT